MSRRIKKNEIRQYMYAKTGKTKEIFYNEMIKKRKKREQLKKELEIINKKYTSLKDRYLHKIPEENFEKLKSILYWAIGRPSYSNFTFKAGDAYLENNGISDGEYYTKTYYYRKRYHEFILTAPRKLVIQVEHFDGLYNIHCKKERKTKDNIQVYKCRWIEKKRGFKFEIVDGYVATKDGVNFHAKTRKEAFKGLRIKIQKKEIKRKQKILTLDSYISKNKFMEITGACKTGCNNWINVNNITQKRIKIKTLIELLYKTNNKVYAKLLQKAIGGGN